MAVITYFYSAHSVFAYLGSARLRAICADHGATLVHRPMALSPVVEAQGSLPFRARTQAHVDYFFGREIERWAEWRNVQILSHRPTHHDADYTLASGMILALGESGPQVDALSEAILQAHWLEDADLSDPATLARVAEALGHDAAALMNAARGQDVLARYAANGEAARNMGVMGSPSYVVGDDMFYGQDRLEMVARALVRPFAPAAWHNPPVDA